MIPPLITILNKKKLLNPHPSYLLKFLFNIILSSTPIRGSIYIYMCVCVCVCVYVCMYIYIYKYLYYVHSLALPPDVTFFMSDTMKQGIKRTLIFTCALLSCTSMLCDSLLGSGKKKLLNPPPSYLLKFLFNIILSSTPIKGSIYIYIYIYIYHVHSLALPPDVTFLWVIQWNTE